MTDDDKRQSVPANGSTDGSPQLKSHKPLEKTTSAGGAPIRKSFSRFSTYDMPAVRVHSRQDQAAHTDKKVLTEEDCYEELAFCWSPLKKWWVLIVVFLVQCSMNLNTSLYTNAIVSRSDHKGLTEEFGISEQAARCGAMVFLVTYAFGCELWAPWSEEFGRKPVLQISLFFVNVWQLPVALAPNFGSVMAGRALGGLFSAGGSVTLGLIADLYEPEDHQYAVNFVVLSSVGGSILGAIIGGFCEQWLVWQWCMWIQLIFGGFVQLLHLFTVPETRTTTMMTGIARRRRAQGEDVVGPDEAFPWRDRLSFKEIWTVWTRPFVMYITEPIVLVLSLLSGFSDGLIFIFIQSFSLVYKQWGFNAYQVGLTFIPLGVGYLLAWGSFYFSIRRNVLRREKYPEDERVQFEERMWWLLFTAPLLPIGLITFAWTSGGPPIHWIGSMICSSLVGIANFAIYMATVDYMISAYGPYSASATGGNGWSRDILAGILTIPAVPFYTNIGPPRNLQHASTILFCIAFVLVSAVFVIYWKGPILRKRSPFAQQLSEERNEQRLRAEETGKYMGPVRRVSTASGTHQDPEKAAAETAPQRPTLNKRHSTARSRQDERIRPGLASRRSSYLERSRGNSRNPSRGGSRAPSRANSFEEEDGPTMSERIQSRIRPGLGSHRNTYDQDRSTGSQPGLGHVQEHTGQEEG